MADVILTESGTNEMELLIFQVGETSYGINVAKVRELTQCIKTNSLPHAPDSIDGTFLLRDKVLTQVNLRRYLGIGEEEEDGPGLLVIVELNGKQCGILVDNVEKIHRLRWEAIEPPSKFLTDTDAPITSIAKVEGQIVLILDFETILSGLLGTENVESAAASEHSVSPEHEGARILMVDDSSIIRKTVERLLRNAGFEHITSCTDGQHAWDVIEKNRHEGGLPFDIVLSDIEMPRMDGLHLTARIKEDPELKKMPVVLFSSLISGENANKGQSVGADAQVTKFQGDELIATIEECLRRVGRESQPV